MEKREIPGFPGYTVTPEGVIFSPSGREMKARTSGASGYLGVSIRLDGKNKTLTLHRACALAWVQPSRADQRFVAHLDGDMFNNNHENLAWVTAAENEAHKKAHGTAACGERNHQSKLTEADVIEIRRLSKAGVGCRPIAIKFGLSRSTAHAIAVGRAWRHVLRARAEGLA